MESIKKLRDFAFKIKGSCLTGINYVLIMDACNKIEREIVEKYMELPVDADGVPIHVGDELEAPLMNDRLCVEYVGESWVIGTNGVTHDSLNTRHIKSDPVKELLKELISKAYTVEEVDSAPHPVVDDSDIDEIAAKIREIINE